MRTLWLGLAAALFAIPGGSGQGQVFQVEFSNPGLSPSHWVLTIHPDGNGHFQSERGKIPADDPKAVDAPSVDRDIRVSPEFAGRIFQMARQRSSWHGECESKLKVAFQGWKKLNYSGPEGEWECDFNYSKDKEIQALGDSLVAVGGTIVEGARLEMLLQHDRLGLDKETEYLMEAADDGRAQQFCTIRGILERLADDPAVLERVRKRARELLARSDG
jgi:hypothetical protein